MASALGAALLIVQRRNAGEPQRGDHVLLAVAAGILGLYLINLGGGLARGSYDAAWMHGVRLTAEPILLLVLGLLVPQARKAFRWGMISLAVTAVGVALVGSGSNGSASGVSWTSATSGTCTCAPCTAGCGASDRSTTRSRMRRSCSRESWRSCSSFALGRRRRGMRPHPGGTGVRLCPHFGDRARRARRAVARQEAARRGRDPRPARERRRGRRRAPREHRGEREPRRTGQLEHVLTINGRTQVWKQTLAEPSDWLFGQGVGAVGTAAERAAFGVVRSSDASDVDVGQAVDNGYLAAIADTGIIGLLLLLVLLARLAQLSVRAIGEGFEAGWAAAALLLVLLLDAVTRASFQAYPTAFVTLLLIGLALNAAEEQRRAQRES